MSNPWEKIKPRVKSVVDWLQEPSESNANYVTCPACGSNNCINVWFDAGQYTYNCAMCDTEFFVAGDDNGLVSDYPITSDYHAYATVRNAGEIWTVEFNIADETYWRKTFDEEALALSYYMGVKDYYGAIVPGVVFYDAETGYEFQVKAVVGDNAVFADGSQAALLRVAVGFVEGKFAIDNTI